MTEKHIIINKTARYYTLGQLNEHTTQVWFVLHGHGQLAGNFIKKFEPLLSDDIFFIAPEALNHFYLKRGSMDVGATWMTREDRLNEIKDYINYLNDLYENLDLDQYANVKITALGFSQGASTVTRWVNATQHRIDRTLVYAGEVAPELIPLKETSGLKRSQNYFVYGTEDEFFKPVIFDEMIARYESINLNLIKYEGTHEIYAKVLKPLV
jgi:predicted esterase